MKFYNFIKNNLINGVIILVSLAYMFYSMISIKYTGLTVEEAIAKAGIGVIIGILIKQGMGENGFSKGYNSDIWQNNLITYKEACNTATPYIDRVDLFYASEEKEKKRKYREQVLMGVALKYSQFFDEGGNYIGNDKNLEKRQKKALNKCIKVKVHNLNLFSEYNTEITVDIKKEKTDKDQRMQMVSKNGSFAILTAIIGAYLVPMWNGWNWGLFIASTIQVAIWLSCGIVQLYANYNYIVIDKVAKLTRKKELIAKFVKGCENGLYKEVNNE